MSVVYLALGTNLGDREENLRRALTALAPEVRVETSSPVYETRAKYVREQPPFYNAVLKAETDLQPRALLTFLKDIETECGRMPSVRYGPRAIDLDILLYGDSTVESEALTSPHPRMHERAFVLAPLADIAPEAIHPIFKKTVRELLGALEIRLGDIKKTDFVL